MSATPTPTATSRRRWRSPFRLVQFRPAVPFGGILASDRDQDRLLAELRALAGAPADVEGCLRAGTRRTA